MEENNWNMLKAVTSARGKSTRDLGDCFRWKKAEEIEHRSRVGLKVVAPFV